MKIPNKRDFNFYFVQCTKIKSHKPTLEICSACEYAMYVAKKERIHLKENILLTACQTR